MKNVILTCFFLFFCLFLKSQTPYKSPYVVLKYSPISVIELSNPTFFQFGLEHFKSPTRSKQYELGVFSHRFMPSLIFDDRYFGYRFRFSIRKYKSDFSFEKVNKYKSIVFHSKQIISSDDVIFLVTKVNQTRMARIVSMTSTAGISYEFGANKVFGKNKNFFMEWGLTMGIALWYRQLNTERLTQEFGNYEIMNEHLLMGLFVLPTMHAVFKVGIFN